MATLGRPRPRRQLRLPGVGSAVALTLLLALSLIGLVREERATAGGALLPAWIVVLGFAAAGAIGLAAWFMCFPHPRVAFGLAVTGAGLAIPWWAGWTGLPPAARATTLALEPAAVAGAAAVALRWSTNRSSVRPWMVELLAGAAILLHWAGYNPFADPQCSRTCIDASPLARGLISTRSTVTLTTALTMAAALLACLAIATMRPTRPPRPVVFGGLLSLGLSASACALQSARSGDPRPSDAPLAFLHVASAIALGAGVLAVAVGTRRTRGIVNRLVTQLSDPETAWSGTGGGVGVQFAVPGDNRWVDAKGELVKARPSVNECIVLSDEAGPTMRLSLRHNSVSTDVLTGLRPAGLLALKNAQLAAVAKVRVSDVQASRRRVVARADAERRRIERDLHDGAQQRIVSASFYLSVARLGLPAGSTSLSEAETLVREALAHLRTLAHGASDSVLATEGLWAALDEAVRAFGTPATLDLRGTDDGLDMESATAAYAAVVAALAHAGRAPSVTSARVAADRHDHMLAVRIDARAVGIPTDADFMDVADRLGALGGEFTSAVTDEGLVVTAVLTCAS